MNRLPFNNSYEEMYPDIFDYYPTEWFYEEPNDELQNDIPEGDTQLRDLAEEIGFPGLIHHCTRAMLSNASHIHGARFCRDCGMLWPRDHLPLW